MADAIPVRRVPQELLVVIRKTANGQQVPIRVDLRKGLNDARERILLKSGDVLLLQEQPSEGLARYFTQTFLKFNFDWNVINEENAARVIDIASPDRWSLGQQLFNVPLGGAFVPEGIGNSEQRTERSV